MLAVVGRKPWFFDILLFDYRVERERESQQKIDLGVLQHMGLADSWITSHPKTASEPKLSGASVCSVEKHEAHCTLRRIQIGSKPNFFAVAD